MLPMHVTLYMAMSINGLIAKEDGQEDFLSDLNWEKFLSLAAEHKNFIIGRKTYEAVKSWGTDYDFSGLSGIEMVVISRNEDLALDAGFTRVSTAKEALHFLRGKGLERALVTGGSQINAEFARLNLFDELILNVEPAVVGKGIPLFAAGEFAFRGKLIEVSQDESILTLRYQVLK